MNKTVSVITPSIRPLGLKLVAESLSKQTYKNNIEWILCMPRGGEKEVKKVVGNIFPYIFLGNGSLKRGMFWDLNYSYNRLLKKSVGPIVVSIQDWIWISPDGLQKFVDGFERFGADWETKIIGGVGDQYERLNDFGKPEVNIWGDPRKTMKYGSFYELNGFEDVEWNYAAFSRKALFDVGGFCEKLDFTGYGMDGYQVNERLSLLGYQFYLDQDNESFTLRHDRSDFGGEEKWNKNNNLTNGQYEKVREEFIKKGEWPRMNYLS